MVRKSRFVCELLTFFIGPLKKQIIKNFEPEFKKRDFIPCSLTFIDNRPNPLVLNYEEGRYGEKDTFGVD